jgi:hypothetical protein
LRYDCNAAADPSLADDARNTASCLKDGLLISAGSGTIWAWATRSRGASSRRPLACGSTPDSSTLKTVCMFRSQPRRLFQTQDDVGLLFGKEGRWRVERGAEARRAKSLTPGFNSNRLLGKASDGNGQAWCKGKRGSRSEVHSNRAPFSDSKPFDLTCENISDASLGLDDLWRARVVLQFAAKAENLHIYAAIEHVFVDSSRL